MNTVKKILKIIGKVILWTIFYAVFLILPIILIVGGNDIGLKIAYTILLGEILYFLQVPIHELGHYLTAKYYLKKKNSDMHCYINLNGTYCENWRVFTEKENKNILLNGPGIRIIYQLIILLPYIFNPMIVIAGIFSIIIDILCNLLPVRKGADGYKIKNLEALYDEETKKENRYLHYICFITGFFLILVSPIMLYYLNTKI